MVTDNTGRPRTRPAGAEGEEGRAERRPRPRVESGPVLRDPSRPTGDPVAIGNAMKALFESSNVSIQRGDETRVINRSLPPSEPPGAASAPPPALRTQSSAPAPRVDVWLWVVLAAGLFAIAGSMIAYALR